MKRYRGENGPGRKEIMNKKDQQEYGRYIKKITPTHSLGKQMCNAFICGGIICAIGQAITNLALGQGFDKEMAGSICSLILILISVLLTGWGIFPSIVKSRLQ